MSNFIHLHNHSDFSLLDSSQSIKSILARVKELGMNSVALTETNNLFSMISFYKQSIQNDIKPILGVEINIEKSNYDKTKANNNTYQLILLAKNNVGYLNLMKLVSLGYTKSSTFSPSVSLDLLKEHQKGLIVSSSGLNGEIAHYASNQNYKEAKNAATKYRNIFDEDFYLEIQNHTLEKEKTATKIIAEIAKELSIPLLATNDTHYTYKEDSVDYEVMKCIGLGQHLNSPNKPKILPPEYYIKSAEEMESLFLDYPESINNSVNISNQCNVEIPMGKLYLPKFPIPKESETDNPDDYLEEICKKSLIEKYNSKNEEPNQRLKYELEIIKKMGFASYFLITQDFVKYAKDNNIPVGPGRGSAVGSIVSYLTGITDLDPLEYNLIFERFLNPDRVSMPDIDIDFCIEGREKVIDYIKELYGRKSVAQIITFGSMKAKSVVRDVGRVLGMTYLDVDKIAKMIPNDLKMTIEKAQSLNKDFDKLIKQDSNCNQLIKHSKKLEGLHRHASTHAAGIVIAPGPLMDYVPLFKNPSTDDVSTQIEMNSLEEMGLLKMDFLGLRNLTVINKTFNMINKNYNKNLNINDIKLDDKDVYSLFAAGNTIGIFQFESRGMRDYLKKLNPSCIEDLIAMNSLYRPGPMANIPEFLDRKNTSKSIDYLHPDLEPILKETYGIIVYQEQVMQIGSTIGGFTLAQSDEMRKAMGKKKKDLMATFKIDFIKGAELKGLSKELAIQIFDLLAKFAEYGFNKSHSAAYSVIAYQTAWLKTHYPAEFMACNMSSEILNTDSIIKLLRNVKLLNIEILTPDVNTSNPTFIANGNNQIQYGLSAIKNVGFKSTEKLADYRSKNGKFKTIFDLCKIGSQAMNKKVLECLIKSGACDNLEGNRAQQFALIDHAIKFGQKYHEDFNSNQSNLFSSSDNSTYVHPKLPDLKDWDDNKKLNFEKEVLGHYLTGNPMQEHLDLLKSFTNIGVKDNESTKINMYKVGGRIFDVKVLYDKKNNPWSVSRLECYNGQIIELFIFNESYVKYKDFLNKDNIIYCEGTKSTQNNDDSFKVIVKKVFDIKYLRDKVLNNINVKINYIINTDSIINRLLSVCDSNKGQCNLILHLANNLGKTDPIESNKIQISSDSKCIRELKEIVGKENVWFS